MYPRARIVVSLVVGTAMLTATVGCHKSSSRGVAPLGATASGEGPVISRHLKQSEILAGNVSLDEVLEHGRSLFRASFNTLDGAGRPTSTGTGGTRPERTAPQNFNRVSGPDSNSCSGCHNQPFTGGGGDNVANVFVLGQRLPFVNFDQGAGDEFEKHTLTSVANERATLGMFGAGYIELLAREMTRDLQATRDQAIAYAKATGTAIALDLRTKGVNFGRIVARADATLDTSGVVGVDKDLVIKPFHQKGVVVSLRQFSNNAMNHHHGMQSVERFGRDIDPDNDGVKDELTVGDMTAITLFQATLPAPGRRMPGLSGPEADAARAGEDLFNKIGCATCHLPEMRLESPVFSEPNPYNPKGNLTHQLGAEQVRVDLTKVGEGPFLRREADGSVIVRAFTDLKRHDMGPELTNEELPQDGVPTSHFLTRKLWGMASEPPFLHHGRALTIREAILKHGGESKASRVDFEKLSVAEQDAVIEFLKTFVVPTPGSDSVDTVGVPSGTIGDQATIGKHLDQSDIDAGKFTADELAAFGKQLFSANFNTLDGAGRPASSGTGEVRSPRSFPENFNRVSGPDANSCAGCHNQPRAGGGGDNVANVFVLGQRLPFVNFDGEAGDAFTTHTLLNVGNERNTLGMWGGGFVELLAREITKDLHDARDRALADARAEKRTVRRQLTSKGIQFGFVIAHADGRVDLSEVEGIDNDLIIKPFHQKGVVISLRQFSNNALNHHHGMQSSERFGAGVDADRDGKKDEVTTGDMTALTLFQAMLPVPGQVLPRSAALQASVKRGEELFRQAGCAACHVPALQLNDPVFTEPNPYNPVGNLQVSASTKSFSVDLTTTGPKPRLARGADGTVMVPVFTDFKRHDLGPRCNNEKLEQGGVPTGMFLTRKLWGVASEPPFLHHGRALTLTEAIQAHGGEAAASRASFRALTEGQRASIIDFLKSLQVLPEGSPRVITR